jgi:transketolase
MSRDLDQRCVNTLRFLSVDMVQKANSGHPGLPLGAAPMAYVLWTRWLKHNPRNPGLAARYNRPGHAIIDHHTFALVSDGDLMEGVASEAASLAGHLALGKLICLYDDNHVTLAGSSDITFSEDCARRFEACGCANTASRSTTSARAQRRCSTEPQARSRCRSRSRHRAWFAGLANRYGAWTSRISNW